MTPEDLTALRQLVDRYADAIDRRDRDAVLAVFTEDGTLTMQPDDGPPESEWSGSEVAQAVDSVERYQRTFHHIGGAVFEAATGSGEAIGRSVCLAHHYERTPNGPVDLVMMIRYHDRFARVGDTWRIAARRVAVEWTELHPAHPLRRRR